MPGQKITIEYNDRVVRQFLLATVIWGAVGLAVAGRMNRLLPAVLMPSIRC